MPEMAHIEKFVLYKNEDARFDDVKNHKKNGYQKKKGENFFTTWWDKQLQSVGFDGPGAVDEDGAGAKSLEDKSGKGQKLTPWGYNCLTQPIVVVPSAENPSWHPGDDPNDRWVDPTTAPGNPFNELGVRGGDCVKVTDHTTGESHWGLYGDNGPGYQVGEMSKDLAHRFSGRTSSNLEPTMTDKNRFTYEFFPGTAKDGDKRWATENKKKGRRAQNFDDIQSYCAKTTADRGGMSGIPIITGSRTVLVGLLQLPAAMAHPSCMHLGDCSLDTGSDSVSIELSPSVRVGDDCKCAKKVVDGEPTVHVYGGKTTTTEASGDFTLESTAFGPEPHASILPPTSAIPGFGTSAAPGIPTR